MLANAAPSKKVLGTLNGVAASAASLSRALGPTISGSIQAAGLGLGMVGLPWWITSATAGIGAVLSIAMVEVRSQKSELLARDHSAVSETSEEAEMRLRQASSQEKKA